MFDYVDTNWDILVLMFCCWLQTLATCDVHEFCLSSILSIVKDPGITGPVPSYLSTLAISGSWGIAWQGCCRRYWRWGMWLESEWRPLTFFKVTREIRWQVSPIIHQTPSASPWICSQKGFGVPCCRRTAGGFSGRGFAGVTRGHLSS